MKSKEETLKTLSGFCPSFRPLDGREGGRGEGRGVENYLSCRSVKQIFRIDNLLVLLLKARACLGINDLHALKPCMLGQATSFDY